MLASGGIICGECLDAGVEIDFVEGSKVVRVGARVAGRGVMEVLIEGLT